MGKREWLVLSQGVALYKTSWNEDVCSNIASKGNLELLQWARANGWFRFAKFYIRHSLI